MFRALIMIFITNPFGVGDWVRFGDDPVAVKIHELGLNFVVVATFWGELIFLPVSSPGSAENTNLVFLPARLQRQRVFTETRGELAIFTGAAAVDDGNRFVLLRHGRADLHVRRNWDG